MIVRRLALVALALTVEGCALGYNSLVFVTQSNFGVDIDSKPPTAQISVARSEGVIEPTLEGGKTAPVMASFKSKTNWLERFMFGVSSTFSAGEAAVLMARYYGDPDQDLDDADRYKGEAVSAIPNPVTALEEVPWLRVVFCDALGLRPLICRPKPLTSENVRPMFFGTDTILGLKIEWSGETGQYPSAVKFGFNRKELAWTPLGYYTDEDGKTYARTPSLLAVLDNEEVIGSAPPVEAAVKEEKAKKTDAAAAPAATPAGGAAPPAAAPEEEKPASTPKLARTATSFDYLQYFATGEAASQLARRHDVRKAMLARLEPEAVPVTEVETSPPDSPGGRLRCWMNAVKGDDRKARRAKIASCIPAGAGYGVTELVWEASREADAAACIKALGESVVTCPKTAPAPGAPS